MSNPQSSLVPEKVMAQKPKILHDMIHPHLELPALCVRMINTPQFNRLRNLKQLGLCYYVYPSACHNRFEHCIGTSYLAGKYGTILRRNQSELNITDEDILCLYIAGLCHDLGHGPFSHTWERFMEAVGDKNYSHEDMSLKMFDYLIEDNGLKEQFEKESLTEADIVFIKECILGHSLLGKGKRFVGRKPCKYFLYQIVSNGKTKIDVDKFDYLLRDCKQLNVATTFDYQRLLDNSRVVGVEDSEEMKACPISEDTETIIVYRKKIDETLEDLFRSRFSMHKKAYQHRVTKVIEEMVLDGLVAAEPFYTVTDQNGETYRLSTACKEPSAFMKLTDSIFENIIHNNVEMVDAAKIFRRIVQRRLYKFLGYFSGSLQDPRARDDLQSKDKNIIFIDSTINYGSGNKNPLEKVRFYEKESPDCLISKANGSNPEQKRTFIVYRNADPGTDHDFEKPDAALVSVKKAVNQWATDRNIKLEFE